MTNPTDTTPTPAGPPRAARPARRWRAPTAALAAALLAGGVLLSGCTNSSSDTSAGLPLTATEETYAGGDYGAAAGSAAGAASAGAATDGDAADGTATDGAAGDRAAGAAGETAPATAGATAGAATGGADRNEGSTGARVAPEAAQRQIVKTANLALAVTVEPTATPAGADPATVTANRDKDEKALRDKVNGIAVKVRNVATAAGGQTADSEATGTSYSITLRVPVAKYDSAMAQLRELGDVTGTESSQDVTGQLADMDGRIKTMQDGITRVRQLLAKATKIEDIITIEDELNGREQELESVLRQRASVGDQAAMSTIVFAITGAVGTPPAAAPAPAEPEKSGFAAGLSGAWGFVKGIGAALAVLAGALIPLLPVLAVLAAIVLLAVRWRRQHPQRALQTRRPLNSQQPQHWPSAPAAATDPSSAQQPQRGTMES
ncbi:DUF4349 domain-containing protein [Nakamurella aerolata]|uniref:DUF4349 domain-containing protein n=1 Tax=Nakamurella aerolata TaxID=1656892 RepID=A0A849A7N6_9ACTN|nr:DUF4349 domain-containing protein [Nakamurella aerolata]NNG35503.1 DUF4349 domain-containing protein [Nakamurella aerolata]